MLSQYDNKLLPDLDAQNFLNEFTDELNWVLNSYHGLMQLCEGSEASFNDAYFVLESLNKRFSGALALYYAHKKQLSNS